MTSCIELIHQIYYPQDLDYFCVSRPRSQPTRGHNHPATYYFPNFSISNGSFFSTLTTTLSFPSSYYFLFSFHLLFFFFSSFFLQAISFSHLFTLGNGQTAVASHSRRSITSHARGNGRLMALWESSTAVFTSYRFLILRGTTPLLRHRRGWHW